jgi:hypothetical protein
MAVTAQRTIVTKGGRACLDFCTQGWAFAAHLRHRLAMRAFDGSRRIVLRHPLLKRCAPLTLRFLPRLRERAMGMGQARVRSPAVASDCQALSASERRIHRQLTQARAAVRHPEGSGKCDW